MFGIMVNSGANQVLYAHCNLNLQDMMEEKMHIEGLFGLYRYLRVVS